MPDTLPPTIESELSMIAERMATILETVPPQEALSALLTLGEKISLHRKKIRAGLLSAEGAAGEKPPVRSDNPSDVGAPPDAPKPVAVPLEVLAEANRTIDENEIAEAIRAIRAGGGLQLEDFLPELEKFAHGSSGSSHV